jgi:hypothetical protein
MMRVCAARLLDENIEIGGGLGPVERKNLADSASWDQAARARNVLLVLDALRRALKAEGFACEAGREAAEVVYSAAAA